MITKIAPFFRQAPSRIRKPMQARGRVLLSGGPFSHPSLLFSTSRTLLPCRHLPISRRMMTRRLDSGNIPPAPPTPHKDLKRFCLIQLHRSTNEFTPRGLLHSYRSQLYACKTHTACRSVEDLQGGAANLRVLRRLTLRARAPPSL
jgi:hypothetical protein